MSKETVTVNFSTFGNFTLCKNKMELLCKRNKTAAQTWGVLNGTVGLEHWWRLERSQFSSMWRDVEVCASKYEWRLFLLLCSHNCWEPKLWMKIKCNLLPTPDSTYSFTVYWCGGKNLKKTGVENPQLYAKWTQPGWIKSHTQACVFTSLVFLFVLCSWSISDGREACRKKSAGLTDSGGLLSFLQKGKVRWQQANRNQN